MATLFGIDGCPAGWLVLQMDRGSTTVPTAQIYPNLSSLSADLRRGDIVAIDMPMGLPSAGERRACDEAARLALGIRRDCVFYAPARGVLAHVRNHATASAWHRKHAGYGISQQCFHILRKVRELDEWLRKSRPTGISVFEVHPELSFAHWNSPNLSPRPIVHSKKSPDGKAVRRELIEATWPGVLDLVASSLGLKSSVKCSPNRRWAQDDLHDAFAALWSAERMAKGVAISYPSRPPQDSLEVTMKITA